MQNPIFVSTVLVSALFLPFYSGSAQAQSAQQAEDDNSKVPESNVVGKGPGMGRAYQENVPGPGKGGPENRSQGEAANPDPKVGSREGQDGAGMGTGYPGYRGHGSDEHPGHKQHGLPPRGS